MSTKKTKDAIEKLAEDLMAHAGHANSKQPVQRFALGGVAKVRLHQATVTGQPKKARKTVITRAI